MKRKLLLLLLKQYSQKLCNAIDDTETELRTYTTPTRQRFWNNNGFAFNMRGLMAVEPTENDPPDSWRWVDVYPDSPSVEKLKKLHEEILEWINELEDEDNQP